MSMSSRDWGVYVEGEQVLVLPGSLSRGEARRQAQASPEVLDAVNNVRRIHADRGRPNYNPSPWVTKELPGT